MAEFTNIAWCDSTFNPWIGCTQVSPGCDLCYAKTLMSDRMGVVAWGAGAPRKRTTEANWRQPRLWNREADAFALAHEGRARRVFCASLADVFDNEVPPWWRADLFALIADTPRLHWLLLTKRIGNAEAMIAEALARLPHAPAWPWPHVWLGATVVDQAEADRDVPKLLGVPAAVRFVSVEPMLGPVDLDDITLRRGTGDEEHFSALYFDGDEGDAPDMGTATLDWVIAGGESGFPSRPLRAEWVRSLRDQCLDAGVPFFFKQWSGSKPARADNLVDGVRHEAWPAGARAEVPA